jgi:hypothetical protein
MNVRIRFLRMAFLVLLVARASFSMAAPPDLEPLRTELTIPVSCPAAPALLERVRTHSSRVREARPGESARVLHVTVTPGAGGFVAELSLVDEGEALERRVPGKTCEEVLAAVALIAALAIDARRGEPASSATPEADGAAALAVAPRDRPLPRAPVVEPPIDGGPDVAKPSRVAVGFGTSVEAQSLDALVLGNALWLEAALRSRLAPSLRLRLARGRSFTVDPQGRAASFRLSTAALEGCVAMNDSRVLQLRPCAQIAGGGIEGASSAFPPTVRELRPWASLGALLQGKWFVLGPLSLEASLGLTVPLVRDEFFFRPGSVIYRAPPLLLVGNVGVGTTFP